MRSLVETAKVGSDSYYVIHGNKGDWPTAGEYGSSDAVDITEMLAGLTGRSSTACMRLQHWRDTITQHSAALAQWFLQSQRAMLSDHDCLLYCTLTMLTPVRIPTRALRPQSRSAIRTYLGNAIILHVAPCSDQYLYRLPPNQRPARPVRPSIRG